MAYQGGQNISGKSIKARDATGKLDEGGSITVSTTIIHPDGTEEPVETTLGIEQWLPLLVAEVVHQWLTEREQGASAP